jgi:hypothetical protein
MDQEPYPGFNPEAALCPEGTIPQDLFSDDLESGLGNWTFAAVSGTSAWTSTSGYATSGTTSLYGNDGHASSDSYASLSSAVSLPVGETGYLRFRHSYTFEPPDYDGGFLEISVDGGPWSDAGPLVDSGQAYNGSIALGFGNPNAGHDAYIDESHGYVSTRLDLTPHAGHDVRFRWRTSTDGSFGALGWLVDDVRLYTCEAFAPTHHLFVPLLDR